MLRSIWIWTATAALILLWAPLLGIIRLSDPDPRRLRTGRWLRRLGRNIARVNPWRIHIAGREHLDPNQVYVIVSNHQSLADIPVITHLRLDTKWLAKAELFRFPVVGWMLRMAGDIRVERSDLREGAKAQLRCARYLRQHCSVVFFPEGTRSRDGQVLPFKDGPFRLAIRERVRVLPLVVEGSRTALPRNTWIFGPPSDIHLQILEPVSVDGWIRAGAPALRDEVRRRMVDALDRVRAK
ncbi:MAG TPA: lysophospholipid acyltransferase family protein [Bryobacteraceae bacterium]|nr:lysophospholipid acyltransferase family protein [Bryobacteraceae bacterium]